MSQQTSNDIHRRNSSPNLLLQSNAIGDGHDLPQTPLEAAFDPGDRRFIRRGERGAHQQSLLDMGYNLPDFGVDGLMPLLGDSNEMLGVGVENHRTHNHARV